MSANFSKVSVVVPVYNEALAIRSLLDRVCRSVLPGDLQKEVIVVDDGSTDITAATIDAYIADHPQYAGFIKHFSSLINHGKGAALRAGFKLSTGDVIIVQDGDLEYNPDDYAKLLAPFEDSAVQVVFGSRFFYGFPEGMKLLNLIANRILSLTTTILYRQHITDEATGYKVFRRGILDLFDLQCRRFEFCPEFTGKVLKAGIKIVEVPITYNPRGILEGKKIRASDGFIAIWWLFKVRFFNKSVERFVLSENAKVAIKA